MKTKYIPAIVMLVAGLINCLYTMLSGMSLLDFTKRLLIVLIIFYIIGVIIKIIVDINFKEMDDNNSESLTDEVLEVQENDMENIETDDNESSDN